MIAEKGKMISVKEDEAEGRFRREGEWEVYNEKGQILQKAQYKNDTLSGKLYVYFEDGSVKNESEFQNDYTRSKKSITRFCWKKCFHT